jgi:hypothetical protein
LEEKEGCKLRDPGKKSDSSLELLEGMHPLLQLGFNPD